MASPGNGTESSTWRVGGFIAGDCECDPVCDVPFEGTVTIDGSIEVTVSIEDNNVSAYQISTPTSPPPT